MLSRRNSLMRSVADRRICVAVSSHREERIVAEGTFEPGSDISLGLSSPEATLAVPGWTGRDLLLLSDGVSLHLGPGMRVVMCHDNGEDRIEGTFEELSARGD